MRKHPDAVCEECPLFDKPCAPSLNTEATTAFVARSPGFYEAQAGAPFSGPSGDVLNHLLKENGVERKDVLLTNVVLCAPDAGKVPPDAIKACAPRLKKELTNCDLIIAGGSEAVGIIIGRGSIDSYRGYRIERGGKTYIASNNPALVLRDDQKFPNLVKDFKRAFNPIPQPTFPEVEVTQDSLQARAWLSELAASEAPVVAFDLETRGGLTRKAEIVCFQWSIDGRTAYVVSEPASTDPIVLRYLKHMMELKDYSYVPDTPFVEIELQDGSIAKVDPEDEEKIRKYKWGSLVLPHTAYARTTTKHDGLHLLMHNVVLDNRDEADHINHDGLDYRKVNLRSGTRSQNLRNKRKTQGENKYKGSAWSASSRKNPWTSYIDIEMKRKHLGYYSSEEEAALVYDIAAYEAEPEFALLNFKPKRWCGHNYKFDTKILRYTYGIEARVDEDTMLLSYACDERNGVHGLEYLLAEEYGWSDYEPESVKRFKRTGVVEDYDEFHMYAGYDVAGTFQLYGTLRQRLEEQ